MPRKTNLQNEIEKRDYDRIVERINSVGAELIYLRGKQAQVFK